MRISDLKARPLFGVTLLFCMLFAGYLGTAGAVKARAAAPKQPESLRQLDASVISLKFFSTPTSAVVPNPMRAYNKDFIRADTHYIWWELQLNTKAKRDKTVRLFIKAIWQRPNGTEIRQSQTVNIGPNIEHPCLAAGWGSTKKGTWLPGTYRVEILIDDIRVAMGSFEVFEKLLK
jgi:hypothetical protein